MIDPEPLLAARPKCDLDSALTPSPVAAKTTMGGPGGPVSMSSPEAGGRTHHAFDRALIGLLHKDKRLFPYGTVAAHNREVRWP